MYLKQWGGTLRFDSFTRVMADIEDIAYHAYAINDCNILVYFLLTQNSCKKNKNKWYVVSTHEA